MTIKRKIQAASMAALMTAGVAGAAQSAMVELAYEGASVWGDPILARNVSYTIDDTARTHGAGLFRLKDVSTEQAILAFCIDIHQVLNLPAVHDTTPFLDATRLGQIERLYSNFYTDVDTANEAAGFQMALWEIMVDTDTALDLSAGRFKTTGTGAQYNAAADYLAGLGGDAPMNWTLTTYFHADSQDLVTGNMVTPVPLPASIAFLLAGLAGLVRLRAHRRG